MFTLTRLTFRRARQERLPQVASSLAFMTLLSIVPMLAVGFALFVRFPAFKRSQMTLEQHLVDSLLPREIARTVLEHVAQFAANAGGLTLFGSLFVLATAFSMVFTVEGVFNRVFEVKQQRPWLKRLGLYVAMLVVGPPLVGASLWASSYLLGASLGLVRSVPGWLKVVLDGGPVVFGAVALAFVLKVVPNTQVLGRHALVGGLLGSAAIELGKRGVAAYLLKVPTYKAVYGAFATLPVFLLWIYFSWLVVLAAALVTAGLGRVQRSPGRSA
jgi:membrane protein